jgi:formylglycine-generating enzyme required for sulfatase activity
MNIGTVIKYAAVAAALSMANPAVAQSSVKDLADMASAAMDAARERSDQAAAPEAVKAIFAKAEEAAEDGAINFCGFHLGMAEDEAKALAAHYGLKEDQWSSLATPASKQVYRLAFTLRGIRRITKGGNSFDELSQAVANRVGTMKSKHDDNYNLVGYEYRNIDGQTALMSEDKGLVLEDSTLAKKAAGERAERAAAERKAAAERAEAERKAAAERAEAERKAMEEDAKLALAKLASDMVPIPGKDYSMCKYEVTQMLWFAVMGENPSVFKGADHPVERVSWNDCQKFLEKLNALPEVKASGKTYRLPTADEWEFACRAGATGDYCKLADGTEITEKTLGEVAWYKDNSDGKTHPVGTKKPNAFGIYDMHGNVWEWTATAVGSSRVDCGGGWRFDGAGDCGAGDRGSDDPDARYIHLGVRLAH